MLPSWKCLLALVVVLAITGAVGLTGRGRDDWILGGVLGLLLGGLVLLLLDT